MGFFSSISTIVNMYYINGSRSNNKNRLKHRMLLLTSIKVPENFLLSLMTIMMATMGIMLMEEIEIREPTPSAQLGNFILLYSVGLKSMAVNNRMAYRKQRNQICHANVYYWLYLKKKKKKLDLHALIKEQNWIYIKEHLHSKNDCHLIYSSFYFLFGSFLWKVDSICTFTRMCIISSKS